jgi:hypothetical protein
MRIFIPECFISIKRTGSMSEALKNVSVMLLTPSLYDIFARIGAIPYIVADSKRQYFPLDIKISPYVNYVRGD